MALRVCVCVMHAEKGADEERIKKHMSTWYPVPILYTYLFTPGFIDLLQKIAPNCRLSTSAFSPALMLF